MAGSTPIYGIPYPQPSDLVANYPALGEDLAEKVDEKLPRYQATAPASPSVGQVWIDSDDNIGRVWTGSAWQPFSGAGNANFSNSATGTYTSGGKSYKYVTFTSNGTLTITQEGWADFLVCGAGGGGGASFGGGGGAGALFWGARYFTAGSISIVCGAGGTSPGGGTGQGGDGGHSRLGPEVGHTNIAFGGGGGGGSLGAGGAGRNGASGGGGGSDNQSGAAGAALALQGYGGSAGLNGNPGGCGGGAGGSPPARTTAGAGLPFDITGSTVYYACGGAGESSTATTGYVAGANGNGGAGRAVGSPGRIIVRVRTA